MAEFEVWPPTEWSEGSEGSNQGRRVEIEGLIGKAYAALRRRDWTEFENRTGELARYEWPEVEFIINEKMMGASHPATMNLAFIYDEVTAAPFSSPPYSGHHSHSPVYPEMTWEGIGGFFNGEAHMDATVREYTLYGYKRASLYPKIEVGQKDPSILEKINAFLEKHLGAIGRVKHYPARDINILHYTRAEDCFRIAKKILPYLYLPLRRRQAEKLATTTLDYARKQAPKERERHRIALAKRWEHIIELAKEDPSKWGETHERTPAPAKNPARYEVRYIDLPTLRTYTKTFSEREMYDVYKLQREGKISIVSIHKASNPPSRWVLEMYAPDVIEWRKAFAHLLRAPLTTRENELVRSFEDYLRRKTYLTARQVEVTRSIAKRHGVEVPAIPA